MSIKIWKNINLLMIRISKNGPDMASVHKFWYILLVIHSFLEKSMSRLPPRHCTWSVLKFCKINAAQLIGIKSYTYIVFASLSKSLTTRLQIISKYLSNHERRFEFRRENMMLVFIGIITILGQVLDCLALWQDSYSDLMRMPNTMG